MPRLQTLKPRVQQLRSRLAQSIQPGSWRSSDMSSSQRGYGYKWQQARADYLRAHPYCVMCLADLGMDGLDNASVVIACAERGAPLPIATVVDHRIPHRGYQALFWDRNNWQALCAGHHNRDKQRDEAAGE